MTLQTLVTILNLNDLFKDSPESVKITAINQVLNNLEIEVKHLYESSGIRYSTQIDILGNTTYHYLHQVLGLSYKEDEVLALFQYSLMDYTNDNPFLCVLEPSVVANNYSKTLLLEQSSSYTRKHKQTKHSHTLNLNQSVGYTFQPKTTNNVPIEIQQSLSYTIGDRPLKLYTYELGYLVQYDIVDLKVLKELSMDYLVTYNIWE